MYGWLVDAHAPSVHGRLSAYCQLPRAMSVTILYAGLIVRGREGGRGGRESGEKWRGWREVERVERNGERGEREHARARDRGNSVNQCCARFACRAVALPTVVVPFSSKLGVRVGVGGGASGGALLVLHLLICLPWCKAELARLDPLLVELRERQVCDHVGPRVDGVARKHEHGGLVHVVDDWNQWCVA